MGGFLLRKAGAALIVVFLASMLVFVGVRAMPGDPAIALGGEERDPAVLEQIRHKYGLDRAAAGAVRQVDLARVCRATSASTRSQLPVAHTIVHRLPLTLELAGLAIAVRRSLIGIPAGVIAAVRRGKADRLRRDDVRRSSGCRCRTSGSACC